MAKVGSFFYGYDEVKINKKVVEMLKAKSLTLAAAESLTGGKFTDAIVSVEGASNVCQGGIISYSSEVKQQFLDIPASIISSYGTVSNECAIHMAENVQQKLQSDIGISFTGIAGPNAVEDKAVGTVFIAIKLPSGSTIVEECHFQGDRDGVRSRAVKKGLELLYHFLKKN